MKNSTYNALIITGISVVVIGSIILIVRGVSKNKFIDSYFKKKGEYVGSDVEEFDEDYFKMLNTSGQEIYALKEEVLVNANNVATAAKDMFVKILKA